ncbi:unnamed protein product [Paramecium primaurelia]|uniref:Arylamine N-acetyltransferase n=1 Tax=Paramecium primaurelia TaxID=5886 RepID=A0A8S1P884_PARPR|nr:unnamed protein product [Paramecium primaurelia]
MQKQIKVSQEDFKTYLKGIGLPTDIKLSVSVETLYLLANKQLIYTFYQNTVLHLKDSKPISLEFSDILQRLCVQKIGGLCYEHELLFYYILKHIGFNVELIQCFVQEAGCPYDPEFPTTHAFLYVTIGDDETYLIDPGFGTRSLRFPMKVNFKDLDATYNLFPLEHYRFTENESHYQFQHLIDDKWVTYYHFFKPLKYATIEEIHNDYHYLFTYEKFSGVRDNRFQLCKYTEQGKIQFFWFRIEKKFTSFKKIFKFDEVKKIEYKSYEELKDDIKKELGFDLPEFHLVKSNEN